MDRETLLKFCDRSGSRISWAEVPYSIGDYTYATNGHVFIKIPRVPDIPENPMAPDPEGITFEKDPEKWVPIKDVPMPEAQECKYCRGKGRVSPCPECRGDGIVFFDNDYNHYEILCESCGGLGNIEFCEECGGTGKTILFKKVDIGGTLFNQLYLAMLSQLPDCEIGIVSKLGANPFRFSGGTGAIMPMRE